MMESVWLELDFEEQPRGREFNTCSLVLMLLSEEKERSIRNQNNLGTASLNQQRTFDSIELHEHGMVLLMLK